MEVVVSTKNKDKFREISAILKHSGIKTLRLESFEGIPEVVEDGSTFKDNACKKALTIARITNRLTVADDSGLEVAALNGAPGVYSARFSGKGATYQSNNDKLLKMLKDVPKKQRKAKFICCVAVADAHGIVDVVFGQCRGIISDSAKGRNGFGYDPVFIYPKLNKTFAQISSSLKNSISHRSQAFNRAKKVVLRYLKSENKRRAAK